MILFNNISKASTDGGPPWDGGGAYKLRVSGKSCFLEIQRGGNYYEFPIFRTSEPCSKGC